MTEHDGDELLSSFLDGDLSPAEAGRIAEHVAQCPECRRTLTDMRSIRNAARALERLEPPDRTWQAIQERVRGRRADRRVRRLPAWLWVGLPALAGAAVLLVVLWSRGSAPAGKARELAGNRRALSVDKAAADAAVEYGKYVQGIDEAIRECEAAMAENPGNARVRSAYLGARSSRAGAMDRLASGGD
jgi:anti-sigma factor RsiW